MVNDATVSAVLRQLDGIGNAPMTAEQREARARPVLDTARLSPAEVLQALSREHLPWNRDKAREFGLPVFTWMQALEVATPGVRETATGLMECIHRAEAAAAMLKAGYRPERDDSGGITWSRR